MRLGWIAVALIALTACGGSDEKPEAAADDVAEKIEEGVSSIKKAVEITEDNDPNDLIGRPGGYDAATVFYDSRVECTELSVGCGATLEVYGTDEEADERADYIGSMGAFADQYVYTDGKLVLRVAGALKPSEAEEYEDAFAD